jgi:hypothetical protein
MTGLSWQSQRGDEWWCGDAGADYCNNTFTIGSFGEHATDDDALNLMKEAKAMLPNAAIYVFLNSTTRPIIERLAYDARIKWNILKNPTTQEAHITTIDGASVGL